jgi:hypothetical protein
VDPIKKSEEFDIPWAADTVWMGERRPHRFYLWRRYGIPTPREALRFRSVCIMVEAGGVRYLQLLGRRNPHRAQAQRKFSAGATPNSRLVKL